MPHYPDEVISYTRNDLLQALAEVLVPRLRITGSWTPMTRSSANGR
jgi:hypothetical protein